MGRCRSIGPRKNREIGHSNNVALIAAAGAWLHATMFLDWSWARRGWLAVGCRCSVERERKQSKQ